MRTVNSFVQTSADDCKISLQYTTADDLPLLREALAMCEVYRKKTHVKHLASHIRKLEKAQVPA